MRKISILDLVYFGAVIGLFCGVGLPNYTQRLEKFKTSQVAPQSLLDRVVLSLQKN